MKTLYYVSNFDENIFSTYVKEKAENFVKIYNMLNTNEFDCYPDKVYISGIRSNSNPIRIEKEADRIISEFNYYWLVTIFCKDNKFIFDSYRKEYLNKNILWKKELLEYSQDGYKITFSLPEKEIEELIPDKSLTSQININKIIFNPKLIILIKSIKERLNQSIKGNILYVIFKNDYECPPRLFKTFSKEKAENFVKEYNRLNQDDDKMNRVNYFPIYFSELEEHADRVINEYLTARQLVTIEIAKNGNRSLINKELKYGELNEDLMLSENGFIVELVLDKNCPVDLESKLITDKIEFLKNKFDFMLKE